MAQRYIVKNQNGHYWGKTKEWVDGSDRTRIAQHPYRDEASNTLFELSAKDFELRAEIIEVTLKNGKLPKLEVSQLALPSLEDADNADSADNEEANAIAQPSGETEPALEN